MAAHGFDRSEPALLECFSSTFSLHWAALYSSLPEVAGCVSLKILLE